MSSVTKQKQEPARSGFWSELFQVGLYKPNQGRIVRQVTSLVAALLLSLGAWEIKRSDWMSSLGNGGYLAMAVLVAIGIWFAYRVVNYSTFADFLIAVEAEMNKVSWPTRKELWNSSVVVMFVIFAMALFLFVFDAIWTAIFETIGIRYSDSRSIFSLLLEWIGLG